MSTYGPFVVIFLALLAAGCIAFIAWQLTSKDIQKSIDRNVVDDADDADGPRTPRT